MNDRHSASSASSSSTHGGSVGGQNRHNQSVHHLLPNHHSSTSPQSIQSIHHQPGNPCEWQLFMVLQRANLLAYYDTFISQGGDDVQQLLEAGEEEFLEIMVLVGMASKPLHVRRLQKALQEYSMNPAALQLLAMQKSGALPPGAPGPIVGGPPIQPYPSPTAALNPHLIVGPGIHPPSNHSMPAHRPTSASASVHHQLEFHPPPAGIQPTTANSAGPGHPNGMSAGPAISITSSESPGATSVQSNGSSNIWPSPRAEAFDLSMSDQFMASGVTPTLTDAQTQRLAECAVTIVRQIADIEPKPAHNHRRKISRELMAVMELPLDSPFRLEEFRRFAAIYGRFDAKRKADKPLTLHEVSVNEAAAQICLHRPAFLTRRDELFPLARLVVKEAGFHYMKTGRPKSEQDDVLLESNLLPYKRPAPSESASGGDEGDGSRSPAPSTSSSSQASPGTGILTISLSPPAPSILNCGDSRSESTPNGSKRQKRRLDEIGMELQRVNAEQEACKRQVNEAQEMGEVISIQRELNRLTQRQLELSDEEASLKATTELTNGQRPVPSRGSNGTSPYPPHPLSDLSRSINGIGIGIGFSEDRNYAH